MTPPSAPRFLGDRISTARRARNLTQAELAEAAGLSQPTISNLERGLVADPSVGTIAAIADALGLPLGALLGDDEQTFWSALTAATDDTDAAPDNDQMVSMWRRVLESALRAPASDIHLAPNSNGSYSVRFRVHGQLETVLANLPDRTANTLIAFLLQRAHCPAERATPQNGMFTEDVRGEKIRVRLSSLMTATGQREVVIRILRDSTLSLNELGLTAETLTRFVDACAVPYGLVLVSGPTGSGRTTTIHASLKELAADQRQVLQINAGDEPDAPGAVAVPTHVASMPLSVRDALHAVLRADPDVISAGEIRDGQTLAAAFDAAQTGHLVFAQMGTVSAVATLLRLREHDVPGYTIAENLKAIVNQRLLRTLCQSCRVQREDGLYTAVGCARCGKRGYTGRIAVGEVLTLSEEMRQQLTSDAPSSEIIARAAADIPSTLADQAQQLAEEGVISADEAARISR